LPIVKEEFAEVVFPLPLQKAFTYIIPAELRHSVQIGSRVIAPFGVRRLTGFIVRTKEESQLDEHKEIQDVLDLEPIFSDEILDLAKWISGYYLCSLGEALRATLPAALTKSSRKFVESVTEEAARLANQIEARSPRQAQILRYLDKSGSISVESLKRRIGAKNLLSSLNQLQASGAVRVEQVLSRAGGRPKCEKYIQLATNGQELEDEINRLECSAPRQAACLQYLRNKDTRRLRDVLKDCDAPLTSIRSLERKGLVSVFEKEIPRDYYQNSPAGIPQKVQLNPEQSAAVSEIKRALDVDRFLAFLLFGITGSGKTQVYIEAIYHVLEKGRDAIVLVPEISLTPQTVRRFRAHFKDQVAVLHSAMSDGERFDSWRRLKSGAAKVAIGPRSAIFAPLRDVGLIVVDEEHESAYKQADVPRYNARDVAIVRAKRTKAAVVLGSATPSAESYYNAQVGKHHLLLPEVHILDLRKEKRLSGKKGEPIFSRMLAKKIEDKLAKKEQIILLLNRRGFSSFIRCKECGYVANCDNCQITLTYHLSGRRLRCHYCGYTRPSPSVCPECSGPDILFRGPGTQKVEATIQETFANARVVRMDLDTTGRKQAHDRILREFGAHKYDILLGTQMVAKGLDFERVTLVGVINADTALLLPDFRSSERTFQLLTQVAGRAGRKGLPGEVIIQTYWPESFCLICAKDHDFVRFYEGEIADRRDLIYPPFGRIISILFRGENENRVIEAAHNYAEVAKSLAGSFWILGPVPSPITKIQKKYRWQILLKGDKERDPSGKVLRQVVAKADRLYKEDFKARGVRVAVDVDPVSLI
jgi:primosomal protein N' (replication factor Y)